MQEYHDDRMERLKQGPPENIKQVVCEIVSIADDLQSFYLQVSRFLGDNVEDESEPAKTPPEQPSLIDVFHATRFLRSRKLRLEGQVTKFSLYLGCDSLDCKDNANTPKPKACS